MSRRLYICAAVAMTGLLASCAEHKAESTQSRVVWSKPERVTPALQTIGR